MPTITDLERLISLLQLELAQPSDRRPSGASDEALCAAIADAREASRALTNGHLREARALVEQAPSRTLEVWSTVTMRFTDDEPAD